MSLKHNNETNTKNDESDNKLSIEQLQALNLIMEGKTDKEISDILKVNRGTIWRWKNKDIYFEAELNRLKNEILYSIDSYIPILLKKSYEIVQLDLESGANQLNTALSLIKSLKLPKGYLIDNYQDLKREKEHKEKLNELINF